MTQKHAIDVINEAVWSNFRGVVNAPMGSAVLGALARAGYSLTYDPETARQANDQLEAMKAAITAAFTRRQARTNTATALER